MSSVHQRNAQGTQIMFWSVENDSQCSGESILSQSSLFCFALSPLSPTHPSNQLWLQAFSGLVASELAKDHQQCRSHNGIIIIVTEFHRFIRFPKAQQIETKSASLDGSDRGQNQQAQVCIPLRTAVQWVSVMTKPPVSFNNNIHTGKKEH